MMPPRLPNLIYRRKAVVLLTLLFFYSVSFAQLTVTISGTVSDRQNAPLQGVTVRVKGEKGSAVTDVNGKYTVAAKSSNSTLVFSYVGFKEQEAALGGQTSLSLSLEENTAKLTEVVVVGYGSQSRATVSTSISKLDNRVLENIPYTNLTNAMQGALPGVRVQTTTGQPGAPSRVIIRGGTSINNPNTGGPLYVVDGIQRNDINDISSEDIESLQVLKDAASTSIYGSRASNGVVIITTKTGRAGRTIVSYSYDRTMGKVGDTYEIVNARDHIHYSRIGIQAALANGYITQAVATARLNGANSIGTGNDLTKNTAFTTQFLTSANQYKLEQGWESMPDPLDPTKTIIFKDTRFTDALFQNSVANNHHVSLSGGTEKATFNAGVGYMSGEGTTITTRYDRLTLNLNSTLQVKDNLTIYGRVLYSKSNSNAAGLVDQLVFLRTFGLPRTAKYTFEDGTLAPGQQQGNGNPAYHLPNQKNASDNETTNYTVGGKWTILKGLSFDPMVSLYRVNASARAFQPSYQNGPGPGALVTTRVASNITSRTDQYQADAILTYTKVLGDHFLEAKTGLSYFERTLNIFTATGQGASTDLIPTLNASSLFTGVSNTISTLRLPGYIGRLNYNFRQKYLLTVNARFDGSSNLGSKNRWGFFPGISAGWVLNKENFWDALSAKSITVKLRGSYGVNGNIGANGLLTDYQSQGEFGLSSILTQQKYNGNAGIVALTLPNPDLKWERSTTVDFGTDIGLFNGRATLLFDYYRRVTDDLLTTLTPPQSTGFGGLLYNLGSLENKGLEVELGARLLPATSKVSWTVSFNAAKTAFKVLRLPPTGVAGNRQGGIEIYDPSSKSYKYVPGNLGLIEGGRIGDWYGYKSLGVYATDADAATAPTDNVIGAVKTKHGGDVIWQDTDGNGLIDSRDRVYLGNAFPTWTGGFSNTIGFKGFTLYTRLDFTAGHSIYNYARGFLNGNWQGDVAATQEYIDKSWKKPGDVTDQPRYNPYEPSSAQSFWRGSGTLGISSQYVEKGDFICVRELTLSYAVPSQLLSRVKITGLRFNITGNNLHYFTNYNGNNPEDGGFTTSPSLRGDFGRYPVPRNIIIGANLTF
jgi:TonB-linked SusC/RagA family outer membrane protein